ncbi:DUF4231 domain-containing protein [Glycomyces tenuis]|uniref:DUF4231 domain-containing protein n=1 Tax=Glycomyces tenuis TaxID=58116 RepID=UPI0009DC2E98|nr:DUF4231 domain-containing protein [Glycomyces tenuis]
MSDQTDYDLRENGKKIALAESESRTLKTQRTLKLIWLISSIIVAVFLGTSMVIGIWANHSGIFSFIGFIAAAFSTAMAVVNILARQSEIAKQQNELLNLHHERAQLAARNAAQQDESLRIYRINIRTTMDRYRSEASQNRRIGNTLQWFIIIGAVVAASSTSAAAAAISSMTWFKWLAASMSMIVAIASSATGFFKFRERSVAKQQTADSIARESQAMELGIRDYKNLGEKERLTLFAERVEDIIEEQRKRELQLEESSREGESRESR